MAGSKESIDKIIAEHSARSLTPPNDGEQGSASQNNSAITINRLPEAPGFVNKNFLHQKIRRRLCSHPIQNGRELPQVYGLPLQIARIVSARTAPGDAAPIYGEMFDVSRAKNPATLLKDFYDRIKDRKKAKLSENKIKYTGKYGVTYAEERVVHLMKDYPEITPDVLNDIEDHINELENLEPSK